VLLNKHQISGGDAYLHYYRSLYCPLLITSLSVRVRVSVRVKVRRCAAKRGYKEGTVKRTFTHVLISSSGNTLMKNSVVFLSPGVRKF